MANGPTRAEFWRQFVASRCNYPAPDRLRAQLAEAEFSDFCECGCNSFAVKASPDAPPLTPSGGGYGAIFTADFKLAGERTLEIVLFADAIGDLAYVEVDCCANNYPVPEEVEGAEGPFHIWAAAGLLL